MIVFNLICSTCEYKFEGWFDNSSAFESQKKRKLINCPNCESSKIKKTLVAPNVGKKSNSKKTTNKKTIASNINKIKKIVEDNFDYVGDQFTEEAKKIKYGETEDDLSMVRPQSNKLKSLLMKILVLHLFHFNQVKKIIKLIYNYKNN